MNDKTWKLVRTGLIIVLAVLGILSLISLLGGPDVFGDTRATLLFFLVPLALLFGAKQRERMKDRPSS
jgi:hypothetical protein